VFQLRNVGGFGSGRANLLAKMTCFYTVDKSRPCCHRDDKRFLGSGLYGQSVEQGRLRRRPGLWQYHGFIQHRVEQAIQSAYLGDYAPFHRLTEALAKPYDEQQKYTDLEKPPTPDEIVPETFCGT